MGREGPGTETKQHGCCFYYLQKGDRVLSGPHPLRAWLGGECSITLVGRYSPTVIKKSFVMTNNFSVLSDA